MDIVSVIIKFAQRSNVPLESRGAPLSRGKGGEKRKKRDGQIPRFRADIFRSCSWQQEERFHGAYVRGIAAGYTSDR